MTDNTDKKLSIKLELPKNPELLERWCLSILDFQEKVLGEDVRIWREIVRKACDVNWKFKYKLQARKELLHDINEYVLMLEQPLLHLLNLKLRHEFGFDLNDFSNRNNRRIQNILKRGVIRNEEEYRLVSDMVEEIYADDSQEQLVNQLNELLSAFHDHISQEK